MNQKIVSAVEKWLDAYSLYQGERYILATNPGASFCYLVSESERGDFEPITASKALEKGLIWLDESGICGVTNTPIPLDLNMEELRIRCLEKLATASESTVMAIALELGIGLD